MNNKQQRETFMADGVLVIDKPSDWTSHDVVARVRNVLRTRRVGHTGTLDPFATGVLVICVNRATRLAQFLVGDDKEYLAMMRLGFATETGDLTGTPLEPMTDARNLTAAQIREALTPFRGRIQQTPPMYSAKKVGGVKLYEMARRGEEIERQPIEIEIKELELIEVLTNPDDAGLTKDVLLRVVCSSGTYVRTLAEDIGKKLGVGAHLVGLRRTRAGACELKQAMTLEQLAELAELKQIEPRLISMAEAAGLPTLRLTEDECKAIVHGRSIARRGEWTEGQKVALCDAHHRVLAIAEYVVTKGVWQPRVVLTPA